MIGLLGFAVLGGIALWRGWSRGRTLAALAAWWAFLSLVTAPRIGLPPAADLLGGDFRAWVLLGPLTALLLAYRAGLRRLKARAGTAGPEATAQAFSDTELDRYSRHILLREIGGPGQRRLKEARVLVVGSGGLGAPALLYLASSGVGTIGVIDPDLVEVSNLQRQIVHADARIGMPKVFSAEAAMRALNPHIQIRPYHRTLDDAIAEELIADYDLILDGSDNFDTRERVNLACVRRGKPLIAGALTQWEGQVTLWDPARGAPCHICIFPTRPAPGMVAPCAEAGVAAPLPGIIGAMMAMEAVKEITQAGEGLRGRLVIHDALHAETRVIAVKRRADCPVCAPAHSAPTI